MRRKFTGFLLVTLLVHMAWSQPMKLHSHNDYKNAVPFWTAIVHGFQSIEVDVILRDNKLYVAHGKGEIDEKRTLESLYLAPLNAAIVQGFIQTDELQLLIDIKSEAHATLEKVMEAIDRFPTIKKDPRVAFVISGNRPKVSRYEDYPDHILFDYQEIGSMENLPLDKIGLVSISFRKVSRWNGEGKLVESGLQRVKAAINEAHEIGKPFRFWASPDSKTSWKTLHKLGVDYINTDLIIQAATYAKQFE